jgi:thiol-disulfide isomerase/thioredoxin
MKHRFYLIPFSFLLLLFLGCADEKQEKNNQAPNKQAYHNKQEHHTTTSTTTSAPKTVTTSQKAVTPKKPISKAYHYQFKNLKEEVSLLDIKHDIYTFKNIKQPIVIVNVMSTWCPPCRGQLPHLSKLQQKFKKYVFIMGLLVHDDISKAKLKKLLIAEKVLFYLSVTQKENLKFINMLAPKLGLSSEFPMPLTIVFVRGKYFTHYEGMIPEEMIESDIKQLLHKIKN